VRKRPTGKLDWQNKDAWFALWHTHSQPKVIPSLADTGWRLRREAKTALGEWLQSFDWDCFATFTFMDDVRHPRLAMDRSLRFIRGLELKVQAVFLAAENHKLGGVHAHGLVKWQPNFKGKHPFYRGVWKAWYETYGQGRFVIPKNGAAVSVYVAKYLTKDDLDWDLYGSPVKLTEQMRRDSASGNTGNIARPSGTSDLAPW